MSDAIPTWKGDLLFTTLKAQSLHRLTLSTDGRRAVSDEVLFEGEFGRLRDVAVGPRGEIYLVTVSAKSRFKLNLFLKYCKI